MTSPLEFLEALSWRQPLWLLLLALPAVAWLGRQHLFSPNASRKLSRHIEPALLPKITIGEHKHYQTIGGLLTLIWVLAALAAAGPYLSQASAEENSLPGANVAVIVDISPSMSVADIPPNRIQQAKLQLIDFVRHLDNARLALVTFSANAYPVLPLTTDRETVIHFINALDPSLVTVAGSNLGRALKLAREALNNPPPYSRTAPAGLVLLVSDGGIHDDSAWQEAAKLKQTGHRLFSIGVGTEAGGPVPLMRGQLVRRDGEILTSTRQRDTLTSLAHAGGGHYYDLSPSGWNELNQVINQLEKALYEETVVKQEGAGLYPWLIILIVGVLLLYGWRRVEVLVAIFIVPALLLSPGADASPWLESQALQALEQGNYPQAAQLYGQLTDFQGAFGLGVTAYRQHHWPDAVTAFQHAYRLAVNHSQKASSSYNLANALAQLGQLDEAIKSYQRTLSYQPQHANAHRNLSLLKRYDLSLAGDSNNEEKPANQAGATQQTGAAATERQPVGEDASEAEANKVRQKLQQSLNRWSQIGELSDDIPTHAIQQLHNLKDDSTLMLRRRFSIEDERAIGLVEEKPW